MPSYFCLSFHFLDPSFHGLRDGGKNEWPPSPMRVFQSVVATAAYMKRMQEVTPSLEWLEQHAPPVVVAPIPLSTIDEAPGYCLSVPNNAMDIVAKAWCRGNYSNSGDASPSTHRTMKTVRPVLLPYGASVHYLWDIPKFIPERVSGYIETLSDTARSISALGWGIDMVVGHGAVLSDEQANTLQGERWFPSTNARGGGLRTPKMGTFDSLLYRHESFLKRLDSGTITPPPQPVFGKVGYRRAIDLPVRPLAAFSLLKTDASGFRAFGIVESMMVSSMMRHMAGVTADIAGWSKPDIDTFILGHGESSDGGEHVPVGPQRFAYLPLPSIEPRGEGKAHVVGSIRRVLITTFADDAQSKIIWTRKALLGQELIDEKKKEPIALLSLIPESEKVVQFYTRPATSWPTVTPVILPGYDDPKHYRQRLKRGVNSDEQKRLLTRINHRIDGLLRKAITQAGFPEYLANSASLEWRKVCFRAGAELADRYRVPQHLKRFSRYHIWLQWFDADKKPLKVPGPICIGGDRFYGLGLFTREGD